MAITTRHCGTVAVVGNGPVGQTAAPLLARWGIRAILLDSRPARDPIGSKAICQQRDVLEVWETVGIGRKLATEDVTWEITRTFQRDTELFAQPFVDHCPSEFPPFVNISQARTEELMDQAIAAQPLIQARWDHAVTGIDQDTTRAQLRCATSTGEVTITADYVILAAGSRGAELRDQLGVGSPVAPSTTSSSSATSRPTSPDGPTNGASTSTPSGTPAGRCSSTPVRTRPSVSTGRCPATTTSTRKPPAAPSTPGSDRSSGTSTTRSSGIPSTASTPDSSAACGSDASCWPGTAPISSPRSALAD